MTANTSTNASARPLLSGLYAGVRDRHQAQLVRVEHTGRRRVGRTVIGEPLNGVGRLQRRITEACPQGIVHERADVRAG